MNISEMMNMMGASNINDDRREFDPHSKIDLIILKDNQSDCFDLISYPDGQFNICLREDLKLSRRNKIYIICRIKTFSDLEILICLTKALKRYGYYIGHLNFAYLFGVRSDRIFKLGQPSYFEDVLTPILKDIGAESTNIFWPFSPLIEELDFIDKTSFVINSLNYPELRNKILPNLEGQIVIAGDESARQFGPFDNLRLFFKKERISQDNIEVRLDYELLDILKRRVQDDPDKPVVIVDDLCDGGATFIAEAQYLRKHIPGIKNLKLFIYHGLFTKGIDIVADHFDEIICTNSYQEINHPKVKQIKVI